MGKCVAYVGTYTHGNVVGIHVYDVDPGKGVLSERSVAEINNPSYLCTSKDKKYLYSIADEGVAAFSIDANGDLTKINQEGIGGMRGCFVDVDSKRRYLFVGGFHDGRVTMMRLNEDGSIRGIADGIFHQGVAFTQSERRIDHPMVSCVKLTPDERYLCAVDHGLNQVKVYELDYEAGKMHLKNIIRCMLSAGPRSIRFAKDGRVCYIVDEMSNYIEVYSYHYDEKNDEPVFNRLQRIATLDRNYNMVCESSCICLSNDDQYVYVSIDGFNGFSVFRRDTATGMLAFEQIVKCSGDFPKSISTLPGDEYVAVLNHDTNEIRTFQMIHDKERPYALMKCAPVKVVTPNCIRILELP
ncbi:MAG: beta-propeller fold lactonase family protein [Lachnospiraceae bacterium]|nr:beta-propeller fold lactonase family protein [Lachnospiraceae bacterium]